MQKRFRFGKETVGVVSGILGTIGYFVISDLSKEDSLIKELFRKIPLFKKNYISDSKEEYYIVDDIPEKK